MRTAYFLLLLWMPLSASAAIIPFGFIDTVGTVANSFAAPPGIQISSAPGLYRLSFSFVGTIDTDTGQIAGRIDDVNIRGSFSIGWPETPSGVQLDAELRFVPSAFLSDPVWTISGGETEEIQIIDLLPEAISTRVVGPPLVPVFEGGPGVGMRWTCPTMNFCAPSFSLTQTVAGQIGLDPIEPVSVNLVPVPEPNRLTLTAIALAIVRITRRNGTHSTSSCCVWRERSRPRNSG